MAHVIVTEGLVNETFVRERCDWRSSRSGRRSSPSREHSPEAIAQYTGVDPAELRAAARLYATGGNAAIYYGLGVTEHSQGSTTVHGDRQPRHGDRQPRPAGRRREPAARPEQRAGRLRHGLVPARAVRLPPRLRRRDARDVRERCGAARSIREPGLRIPNMLDAAVEGTFKAIYIQGEDILQSDPNTHARRGRPRGDGMRRRAGPVPERDRQLRARVPAGLAPSWRRTARSPTPSGASSACAR